MSRRLILDKHKGKWLNFKLHHSLPNNNYFGKLFLPKKSTHYKSTHYKLINLI